MERSRLREMFLHCGFCVVLCALWRIELLKVHYWSCYLISRIPLLNEVLKQFRHNAQINCQQMQFILGEFLGEYI